MRKHRKLLIALSCLAVVAGVVVFASRNNEPHYQGKSLSEWLCSSQSSNPIASSKRETYPRSAQYMRMPKKQFPISSSYPDLTGVNGSKLKRCFSRVFRLGTLCPVNWT